MKYALAASLLLSSTASADPPGKITGTVIYEGVAPVRKDLKRDTDPYCKPGVEDDVIVTKGKLKDVFVRIKNPPKGSPPPPKPTLDQRDCTYTPHVVAVAPGSKIGVRNSDGTFHNVNGSIAGKLLWNKPMAAKDPDLALDAMSKAGDVIDLVCNVHPWMHAYAVAIDHSFYAITGEDGTFTLSGLPAGAYTLEAWHPKLGTRTLEIKIGTGAKATVPARIGYKAE
jgi:plastocyanin